MPFKSSYKGSVIIDDNQNDYVFAIKIHCINSRASQTNVQKKKATERLKMMNEPYSEKKIQFECKIPG